MKRFVLTALLTVLGSLIIASVQGEDIALSNPGFEAGLDGWETQRDKGTGQAIPAAAHTGALGLRITDESETAGSEVESARWPSHPGAAYRLTFFSRVNSGSGAAVFVRFRDPAGKYLNPPTKARDFVAVLPGNKQWREWRMETVAPEGTATVSLYVHSYEANRIVVDFDDFRLEQYQLKIKPPWEPAYKIHAAEHDRLTPADVLGPDGLAYPDWRMAGVPGGIPETPAVVEPAFFAGLEGKEIADRLQEAIQKAEAHGGGGAVCLPEGHFSLDHPVVVRGDGIVVRGAGAGKTILTYRDRVPLGEIHFFNWAGTGQTIRSNATVEIQANPKNLAGLKVEANGKAIVQVVRDTHWANRFTLRLRGDKLIEQLGVGEHELKATVNYRDGQTFSRLLTVELVADPAPCLAPNQNGAFVFAGQGTTGEKVLLAADGKRGDKKLLLPEAHGLKVGEYILIEAPATEAWNKQVGNAAPIASHFRINQYQVAGVDGAVVALEQALRIPFPVADGAFVQRILPISKSGIENLTVEQAVITTRLDGKRDTDTLWYPIEDLWTDGVTFNYAWGCWIRGVRIVNAGRNPLYLTNSKFCEIRDSECDGALFKGGGGTAYVGLEGTFDSLLDSVTTKKLRHAPDLQWGSAGNVVRNSHFIGSDAQFHAGWTHENLLENNVITALEEDRANGSYGFGIFASGPSSTLHGPQGPRNVIYHNEVSSPKDGLKMLGGNEGWIISYNKFTVGTGRAVDGEQKTFDHIIKGNVFVIEQPLEPAIMFQSPDCTGVEILANTFQGPIKEVAGFRGGLGKFAAVEGNTVVPLDAPAPLPRASDAIALPMGKATVREGKVINPFHHCAARLRRSYRLLGILAMMGYHGACEPNLAKAEETAVPSPSAQPSPALSALTTIFDDAHSRGGKRPWVDNGAWANSVANIEYTDDGGVAAGLTGFAQILRDLPKLDPASVYFLSFRCKAIGQVEKAELRIRLLASPYTSLGIQTLPLSEDWSEVNIQFRPGEFGQAAAGGLYVILQGTGTFSMREMSLRQGDAFHFLDTVHAEQGELLGNGGFRLGEAGWAGQQVAIHPGGADFLPLPGNPAVLTQEETFDLHLGKTYVLSVEGDDLINSLDASLFGDGKTLAHHFEIDPVTGRARFQMEGPKTGFLREQMPVFLELRANSPLHLRKISLREEGDGRAVQASRIWAAGCFEKAGRLARRVTAGDGVDLTARINGVPAGTPLTATIRNLANEVVWKKEDVVKTLPDSTVGCRWEAIYLPAGWYDLEVLVQGKAVGMLPAELAVLAPVPDRGDAAPFVLGAHLLYWSDVRGTKPDEEWVTYRLAGNAAASLKEARRLGITSVRLHPPLSTKWWYVEPKPGEWRFGDEMVDAPLGAGMSVLGLLDGSTRDATSAPKSKLGVYKPWPTNWGVYPPQDLAGWRNYVRQTVTHFKGRVSTWEIWNEPDNSMFLMLGPDWQKSREETYADLVKAASEEAHRIDPAIHIAAGAVTASGKKFLEGCLDRGMLADCDAVSFHGYGRVRGADRGAVAFTDLLGPLRQKIADTGRPVSIWDTEANVESAKEGRAGAAAGRLELKGILVRRALGISRLYLYSGFPKSYPLHEDYRMLWGFNDRPLVVQPMLATVQNLLGGATFEKVLIDEANARHVYLFREGSRRIAASWTSSKGNSSFDLPKISGTIVSECGEKGGTFADGKISLTPTVQYFIYDAKDAGENRK